MKFKATTEQEKAINANGNILVSAAAGSGKTAVLVERVIQKLTNKVSPTSADRLLIVTFTNAAAAEMRQRIEKRLDDECRNNPDDISLLKQKQLLSGAKICTIDSFCIDLVRENFDKCGVSPDFKISDGYSLDPINDFVIGNIVSRYMEEENTVFIQLCDIIGAEYDENNFKEFVKSLYDYSRQMPFPLKWFESLSGMYNNGVFDCNSLWYQYSFSKAINIIEGMRKWLSCAVDISSESEETANKYMNSFIYAGKEINELYNLSLKGNWDDFYKKLIEIQLTGLKRATGSKDNYDLKTIKTIWDYLKTDIEKLSLFFYSDSTFINSQFKKLYKPLILLSKILKEYDEQLFCEYSNENTFTFHNTEHLALSLLCDEKDGKVIVKTGAEEFLSRFDEVMVDEYQDTNDLQDMLFYVLSAMESKLFVVGDVKQSIYAFRGANPDNFLAKKERYIPFDKAENKNPKKIILKENFRCREEVCNFINYFFKRFMIKENGNIDYNSEEELVPAADFPKTDAFTVGMNIVETGGDDRKKLVLEAISIAEFIKKIISSGKCIRLNENEMREAKYSDFTILLRSPAKKASVIAEQLRLYGIPVNTNSGGYADSIEIQTFLSLLKVIDNPKCDVELLCIMMSPIFGFSADEMSVIRIGKRNGDLFSAVVFAAENGDKKAQSFLKDIEKYRLLAVTLDLPRLISKLLIETEYLNIISAFENGIKRRNNLLLLCDYAKQYANSSSKDIKNFIDYIVKQSVKGIKCAAVLSGEDTVKIMSIHASKGLQFPVCIIADTATAFGDNESRESTLYSSDFGIGFKYYSEEDKTKYTTVSREVILDSIRKKTVEEELRLLYVAMTRTEDMLLFTGSVSTLQNKIDKLIPLLIAENGIITNNVFKRTRSYFEWLLLSALTHPDGKILKSTEINLITEETKSHVKINIINHEDICDFKEDKTINIPVANSEFTKQIKQNINYIYPYKEIANTQAKCSVSVLANKAESDKYSFTGRPAFLNDGGITSAEKGTAMHKIIQFIDFSETDNIEDEIERLYEWQYISEREEKSINVNALKKFFNSELFKRIKKSNNVNREMRFITELPAIKVNPKLKEDLSDEKIIVQGAVDLCFEENEKIVLVDFKTDRTNDINKLKEAYGEQLSIYSLACSKIFEKPVKEKIIYSFSLSDYTVI